MCRWNCLLTVNSTRNGSIDLQLSVQIVILLAFIHKQSVIHFLDVSYQTNLNMKRRHVRFHIAIMYHGCKC